MQLLLSFLWTRAADESLDDRWSWWWCVNQLQINQRIGTVLCAEDVVVYLPCLWRQHPYIIK